MCGAERNKLYDIIPVHPEFFLIIFFYFKCSIKAQNEYEDEAHNGMGPLTGTVEKM